MAEHRIVVPGVGGSNPLTHPIPWINMSTYDTLQLGLDIGGSSIKYGWGCKSGLQYFGSIHHKEKSLAGFKQTVDQILEECRQKVGWERISAVGIGTPGTIDLQSSKLVGVNPNLPFWTNLDPRDLIPANLNIPVFCDNDANVMCLAEAWLRGSEKKVAGITVGSGIGCGFVVDGKIYRGAHGYAMELGHTTSFADGEPCFCGRYGCLEAYTSVEGLKRRMQKIPGAERQIFAHSGLRELLDFSQDKAEAKKIIQEGLKTLARGISDLVVILDPDVVVLGGGAMDGGLYPFEELAKTAKTYMPAQNAEKTTLEKALEGNRAGVLGAIILASQGV